MRWQLKAVALGALTRIPGGRRLYLRGQAMLGTTKIDPREAVRRAMDLVSLVREVGASLDDAVVLELGTGWHPVFPILARLLGARRVMTIDQNPWLTVPGLRETLRAVRAEVGQVVVGLTKPDEAAVLRRLTECERAPLPSAREGLHALGIEYRCPGDGAATGLASGSVDIISSSNVLEHVPNLVIEAMHAEAMRILRPGGLTAHRFNPADHFSHSDDSITSVHFLKYSSKTWERIGAGLAFHNRLRCSDHRRMLARAGFEVLVDRVRVDPRALDALRGGLVRLHPDFQGYDLEDLAGEYMWLVGRSPTFGAA